VAAETRGRLLEALAAGGVTRLCEVGSGVVGVSGAGVMLMSNDVPQGSAFTSDGVSAVIEDLQYTLGEGPCVDAHHQDRVVFEPDLVDPVLSRWPAFTPPALGAGVRAVFGFPLQVGAARLGALNLYRDRPGPLSADQHSEALVFAHVVAYWVLAMAAGAADDVVPRAVEAGADFHYLVQNAAGIVSVQLEVSVTEALIRIRAYAFRANRLVDDVAADIVARILRLD
jgi:hypothetical protein